ncbi:DNA (cytosine-5)-methyltransferase DRM2-like [Apium graveolens]|uniref:DNA (cytosine-5)-methyltransferase DRM2-like n=1 Tax=Apium graveolens TaxID=4045 RepID=UPI003D7A1A29
MSGRFSKKRYPRKVVFKAMEEHGEDDEEPVLKTPLTHMALDNLGDCLNYMSDDPHVLKSTSTNYKKRKVVEHTKSTTYRTREKPMIGFGVPNAMSTIVREDIEVEGRGPPYFYFENVAYAPQGVWLTIRKELYDIEPEFVDSLHMCAATRKRGYIHNLPMEDRLQIPPIPPSTIQEALPSTKEWWPQWDDRTKLNCIVTRHASASDVQRINEELRNSGPDPPKNIRENVIRECRKRNLVWLGKNTVDFLQPVQIEAIMGFPEGHTRVACKITQYKCLGNAFQVDTVAYHLSVLKKLFPKGIRVLSLFSGIGGAEVALHRLGIPLNFVVSVENSKDCTRILKNWWRQSEQKGRLIHISDVKKVTSHKLMQWMKEAGRFDLVHQHVTCGNV